MQVFDSSTMKFVCSQQTLDFIREQLPDLRFAKTEGVIGFVDLSNDVSQTILRLEHVGVSVSPRIMDCIYFAYKDLSECELISVAFFESIATQYEALVNKATNLNNIAAMSRVLSIELQGLAGRSIIDFGCGIGLSVESTFLLQARLIGVDSSPEMRRIAKARGMKEVWGQSELASASESSIDGVFASYILHLLPSYQTFLYLWSALKVDGVFIGNCHKGEGRTFAYDFFLQQKACEVEIAMEETSRHGPYVCFRKCE